MTKLPTFLLLCGAALGQATMTGNTVVITDAGATINIFVTNSITTVPANIGAIVGGTVPFTAFFSNESNTQTAPACPPSVGGWTSSNPSFATIDSSTGIATAVANGTTTISCTQIGLTGTATLVVETAPNFTTPATPCATPCVILGGTQSQAYSYTFTVAGGTPGYTYSITAGSLPAGLSRTAGVISGTPTGTGTSTFTIQVCDSLSACSSLQISLTIAIAGSCTTTGPPTYTCASTSTADTTTPLTSIFTSTASPSTTCSGQCQNAEAEDTQEPGHVTGTYKYTRITDGVSLRGKSVTNFTPSGGDNARVISQPNGQFLYPVTSDGQKVFELSVVNHAFQVVNTANAASTPIIRGLGFEASGITETRFYHRITTAPSAIYQGDLTNLVGGHVVNGTTSYTDTLVFDYMKAGNCPIVPYTVGWTSQVAVSMDDDVFMMAIGPAGGGGQGYADIVFAYSKTKGASGGPGCAVINFATGQQWAFNACVPGSCTGSETATYQYSDVASQCWGSRGSIGFGVHNAQLSGDGNFAIVSRQNASSGWIKGGCVNTPGGVVVNLNTGLNQFCAVSALQCAGHNSAGKSKQLDNYWASGMTIRSLSDVTTFTLFYPIPAITDEHCSWPASNNGVFNDTMPWLCAGNSVTAALGGVYTPKYLNNELWAIDPTLPTTQLAKRFGHTFSCNANVGATCTDGIQDAFGAGNSIGMARPQGDGFCYVSSMLHQLGNDITGAPRADAFCVYMGN